MTKWSRSPLPSHLEPLADGLDRTTTLLHGGRDARQCVVHVGDDVVLHHLNPFIEDMLGCAILLLFPQAAVSADDVHQLVRQVILGPESMREKTSQQGKRIDGWG